MGEGWMHMHKGGVQYGTIKIALSIILIVYCFMSRLRKLILHNIHGRAPNILIFMVVLMPCGLHDVMSRMLERERYRHWEDHIIFLNYANQLN